ncbi:MAG: hypothetical protein HY722_16965 [Planctomycetes bacterium]|nr:hypothetical protein [Planctomycetota bacterium]
MRTRLTTAALAALGLAAGCYGGTIHVVPAFEHAQPHMAFPDMPVPAGLRYLPAESYAYQGPFRSCDLTYRGEVDLDRVTDFYRLQMPATGWRAVRTVGEQRREMFFENDREACKLTLHRVGDTTTVRIEVHPAGA